MLTTANERLFLALNAPAHPDVLTVTLAWLAASWLIYVAAAVVPALWIWGRHTARGALLVTVLGVGAALSVNQLLGLLWYEPRPFVIGLGHTLAFHAVENSFPSDHATFMWSLGFALITTGAARTWGTLVCFAGLLIAWSRIYLGLHFPVDMTASFLIGVAGGGLAGAALPVGERWLQPVALHTYEVMLRSLRLPPSLFPRGPER